MKDPRIAIVRDWYENHVEDHAIASLLSKLDAHATAQHSADEVERVAKAIYEADGTVIPWSEISERERDGYRGLAAAALSALPLRDSHDGPCVSSSSRLEQEKTTVVYLRDGTRVMAQRSKTGMPFLAIEKQIDVRPAEALPPRDDAERFVEAVRKALAQQTLGGSPSYSAKIGEIGFELDRLDAARKAKQ